MTTGIIVAAIIIILALFIGLRYGVLKRMIQMIVLVIILLAVVFGLKGYMGYQMYKGMMAADHRQTVSTAIATSENWQNALDAVGSLRAAKGVDISNELAGTVETITFHSGGDVKAGTLLVQQRAEDDIAKLHSLEATAKLAAITYARDKKQFKAQAVSKATLDNDEASLENAKAQVAEQKAVVDKKFIRAPFSGHLGIRNIDVGQYLTAGASIVTLQQLDPIYLDFNLPQQALGQIKVGQALKARSDTYPDRVFEGKITAINPKVDTTTRNVQVRASLKNADHALLPGMYATGSIDVGEPESHVTLPQTAITYNPYGDTVYLVLEKDAEQPEAKDKAKDSDKPADVKAEKQLVVKQTFVTVGATRGDQVQILKGVKEGDVVVTSGQLKLQNGAGIIVNNTVTPTSDANPRPEDH